MPQEQSEASPYKSRFGGGYCTFQQFLAETMCARRAKQERVDLPHRFWQSGRWKREFLLQVRHANSLLKIYEPKAVSAALSVGPGLRFYSLGNKALDPLVQDAQQKLDAAEKLRVASPPKPKPPAAATQEPPRPVFVHEKTDMSKLRDL